MTEPRTCKTARPARRYDPECSGPPDFDVIVYRDRQVLMRTPSCYRHGADEEERARRAGGIARTRLVPAGEDYDWEP